MDALTQHTSLILRLAVALTTDTDHAIETLLCAPAHTEAGRRARDKAVHEIRYALVGL